MAETSGLLNRRTTQVVPRVRIPLSPPLTTNELSYAPDGIASKAQHLRAFSLFAIDFHSIKTPRFSLIFLIYAPFLKNTVLGESEVRSF